MTDNSEKSPKMVNANHVDTLRIEVLGASRAHSFDAVVALACVEVLNYAQRHEKDLKIWENDGSWFASCWTKQSQGANPREAIVNFWNEFVDR